MSQGLKITQFPDVTKNQLEDKDFFLISEFIRDGVYATKKLSAKYITNLKTEAVNLAATDKTDKEIYAGINTGANGQSILKFRTLKAGTDVNIDQGSETLTINSLINGSNITQQADNNATIFLKKESSLLKFKSIVGEKGILTRSDDNKVYIKPKDHHYFFIPANPDNPTANKRIFSQGFAVITGPNSIKLPTDKNLTYDSGSRTASLAPIINACPPIVKDSINAAEKCLAFVRISFNTNSGGNFGHKLSVKGIEDKDFTEKISIDPTGGGGAAWEGEDTCTTIIEFDKKTKEFNWKVIVNPSTTLRPNGWEFTVTFAIEGFFV